MEVRQLAAVEDIQAVELECRCGRVVRIDRATTLNDTEVCPGCEQLWWGPHVRSNVYRLLVVLFDFKEGTFHLQPPNPETERHVQNPPHVRLVLPGRLDRPPNLRRPGRTDPMTPDFGKND